jgi:hypothetical protein
MGGHRAAVACATMRERRTAGRAETPKKAETEVD